MDNEYTAGIWEHDIAFTTAPGTEWTWRRCFAVGGKTNFWGRSSARFSEIDFKAPRRDGYDVDWPVTYDEIAPYYTRVERHDRRCQHGSEPSQQSGWRLPAAYEVPLHRSHSGKRGRTRSAFRTCRTASRNSRARTMGIPRATTAATAPKGATPARSSPRPGSSCRRQRNRAIWKFEPTLWRRTFLPMRTATLPA